MPENAVDASIPLCVDLDGTLIRTDILAESLLLLIKKNPLYIFKLPFWLLKGKAYLKAEIASRISIKPETLPYNTPFLDWLRLKKKEGRRLWLCTATHEIPANAIADYLQIFDGVVATSGARNLSGAAKAKELAEKFSERGFDYCGNEAKDLDVWQAGRGAIVVNGGAGLEKRARKVAQVTEVFPREGSIGRAAVKAIRPQQWVKNALVLVPVGAAHTLTGFPTLLGAITAFFAFSFCASSVYLINDLLDIEADRLHPQKSKRPFASGDLPVAAGFALVPALFILAFCLAAFLPGYFLLVLAGYFILSTVYTFLLKRIPILDALCLAVLYMLRIVAGAVATNVPLSFWLLLFSVFFFLSLALVKRYVELDALRRSGKNNMPGRGYQPEDLMLLEVFGIVSGYLSVLVLALYINSPNITILYRHPKVIWGLCLVILYWISRVWLRTHRGKMHDDPVVFALKDKSSYLLGFISLLILLAAV